MTTVSQLASAWDPEPLVLAGTAAAAMLFTRAWIRLRRRGRADRAGVGRLALFAFGLALVTLPLVSPLDVAADRSSLSAHMLQHLLLGDAGPALLLLAVRGPLIAFMIPAAAIRCIARQPSLHNAIGGLGRPGIAFGAWAAVIACWHVPAAYDAALRHPLLHGLEHLMFIAAGLIVWWHLLDPAGKSPLSVGERAAFAGGLFLSGQLLCFVFLISPTPLYAAYSSVPGRLFGLSPLVDQQYAGLVMTAEQFLTLGTFMALFGASLLRRPHGGRPALPAV
jgi:putative membrane protein